MNPLLKFLKSLEPKVEGNKYLKTTFDALFTFAFKPNHVTHGGTHIKDGMDLKRTMVHVVIAMQLCLLHGVLNIGHQHYVALGLYPGLTDGLLQKALYGLLQLLPLIVVVHIVGLGIEFMFAASRGHQVEEGFLVSGMLIPLVCPPDMPLWMVALATAFAVIIAKEAFGGTGMNILNVALTARVFLFFAYPTYISGDTCWVSYDYNWLHQIFGGFLHANENLALVDGYSGATPLALAAQGGWSAVTAKYSFSDILYGFIPGSIGEMNKIAIIIGALMLIALRVASWRIMVSMVVGCLFTGLLFNIFGSTPYLSVPYYLHPFLGSFLFAMAFMATDPVTASGTNTGKLIYGFLIGVVGMIIRVLNPAYPEGWMLAILIMNIAAPLIDYFVIESNINRRLSRAN
jgi:Na+-transporting NADH:ubiquinone oxidoreductase subunit B